jgi:hypothetical protein
MNINTETYWCFGSFLKVNEKDMWGHHTIKLDYDAKGQVKHC